MKWDKMTDTQKILAIKKEMALVTHNGTTKDDLLNMLTWLWNRFEVSTVDSSGESKNKTVKGK